MKRKVIKVENYIHPSCPHGSRGSNVLTLECGHIKAQKGSIRIPKHCRCRECDREAQS